MQADSLQCTPPQLTGPLLRARAVSSSSRGCVPPLAWHIMDIACRPKLSRQPAAPLAAAPRGAHAEPQLRRPRPKAQHARMACSMACSMACLGCGCWQVQAPPRELRAQTRIAREQQREPERQQHPVQLTQVLPKRCVICKHGRHAQQRRLCCKEGDLSPVSRHSTRSQKSGTHTSRRA